MVESPSRGTTVETSKEDTAETKRRGKVVETSEPRNYQKTEHQDRGEPWRETIRSPHSKLDPELERRFQGLKLVFHHLSKGSNERFTI